MMIITNYMPMLSLSSQTITANTTNSILDVRTKKASQFKIKPLLPAKQKVLSSPENDAYIYVRGYN